jgi:hypothetical protein
VAEDGAMWVVGDWGQASPWSRSTGVKMVKGANDVYTGELSLPKGTKFDIKILKSTVSTTSGGDNTWSAVRYASTLNTSTSHGFGEFADNLIPNGNFDEGQVKWTPAEAINEHFGKPDSAPNVLRVGGKSDITSCSSDIFTIPPGQTLRLSGYLPTNHPPVKGGVVMKIVTPQQQTLFECDVEGGGNGTFRQFSKTFKSMDVPMECRITLSNTNVGEWWLFAVFDTLSLVSP